MVNGSSTTIPLDEVQARKANVLLQLLEAMIADVQAGRLYGEYGVTFTAQGGKIGHFEEHRKTTFK